MKKIIPFKELDDYFIQKKSDLREECYGTFAHKFIAKNITLSYQCNSSKNFDKFNRIVELTYISKCIGLNVDRVLYPLILPFIKVEGKPSIRIDERYIDFIVDTLKEYEIIENIKDFINTTGSEFLYQLRLDWKREEMFGDIRNRKRLYVGGIPSRWDIDMNIINGNGLIRKGGE